MEIGKEVQRLTAVGVRPSEIARRLRVAHSTVEYHLGRLEAGVDSPPPPVEAPDVPDARRQCNTHSRVVEMLATGMSRVAVASQLGLTKSTVSYHARRAGAAIDSRCARRYDWTIVQQYYDLGHSVRDCRERFGFSTASWNDAVRRGAVVPRPVKLPTTEFFAAGVFRSRTYLKLRLIAEGHKQAVCEICSLDEWRGQPLQVALHHVNGDRDDNRIENLQLLCPNCHSQTESFSGRNKHRRPGRRRLSRDAS